MQIRVFIAVVLLGVFPLAGQPVAAGSAAIRAAGFIFRGTVQKTHASNVSALPASARTIVVRVDENLKATPEIASVLGKEVTVEMRRTLNLKEGQQAVFYNSSWLYGETLAVK